jgi:hypothetical protein
MHFSITAEIFNEKAEEARHPRLTRLDSARLGSPGQTLSVSK